MTNPDLTGLSTRPLGQIRIAAKAIFDAATWDRGDATLSEAQAYAWLSDQIGETMTDESSWDSLLKPALFDAIAASTNYAVGSEP